MKFKDFSKGQAAIEFIMTYAWVILIISIVLVVVWQLGLLDLGGSIEPGSMGFWGVTPEDYRMTEAGTLTLSLANYIGANLTIDSISANQSTLHVTAPLTGVVLEPGELENVNVAGLKTGKGGKKFEVLLSIDYTDSRTGNQHKSSGRVWGSYES
ncbi:MAG: hypothetical protein ABH834_02570 [Candidatus Altiarchaeota archaeon]